MVEQTFFNEFIKQARAEFVNYINSLEWNNELRTKCGNLLIAYDQMKAKCDGVEETSEKGGAISFGDYEYSIKNFREEHKSITTKFESEKPSINYDIVLGTIDYKYEHLLTGDDGKPCPIDGWMPIATERIKHPEKIPEYIERGQLRLIKPQ